MKASEYTERLREALQQVHLSCHLYQGKDGAKRIAREYGVGLVGFSKDEATKEIRNSYMALCVRGYNLKPPLDAKEWNSAVQEGYGKAEG